MATTTSSTRQEISRRKRLKGWRRGGESRKRLSLRWTVCELLNITVKYRGGRYQEGAGEGGNNVSCFPNGHFALCIRRETEGGRKKGGCIDAFAPAVPRLFGSRERLIDATDVACLETPSSSLASNTPATLMRLWIRLEETLAETLNFPLPPSPCLRLFET